jgi:hypothetical protein
MKTPLRWLQTAALVLAALIAVAFLARFLLSPVTGDLLILASAGQPDHIQPGTIELHSRSGWLRFGEFGSTSVPAAPDAATLVSAKAPVGSYDAVRIAGRTTVLLSRLQRPDWRRCWSPFKTASPPRPGSTPGAKA